MVDVDERLAVLHDEARTKIVAGDLPGYVVSLKAQTILIAGLSDQIEICKSEGAPVSPQVEAFVLHHSALANQALNDGSDYSRVAFFPSGTDRKGPSILRLFAESQWIA